MQDRREALGQRCWTPFMALISPSAFLAWPNRVTRVFFSARCRPWCPTPSRCPYDFESSNHLHRILTHITHYRYPLSNFTFRCVWPKLLFAESTNKNNWSLFLLFFFAVPRKPNRKKIQASQHAYNDCRTTMRTLAWDAPSKAFSSCMTTVIRIYWCSRSQMLSSSCGCLLLFFFNFVPFCRTLFFRCSALWTKQKSIGNGANPGYSASHHPSRSFALLDLPKAELFFFCTNFLICAFT